MRCNMLVLCLQLFLITVSGTGVPGIRIRGVESQQCQCTEVGCGCSTGLYCGGGGLCFSCSQLDCRGFPNAGCNGCGGGTSCDQSTGRCVLSGSIPSTCQGLSCTTGQGSPVWDGSACRCQCLTRFSGTTCNTCAYGYSNYPSCIASTQCNGVVCRNGGTSSIQSGNCACQCPAGFAGATCEYCAPGYRGYPQCVSDFSQDCVSTSLCNGFGSAYWSVSGNRCVCQCQPRFTGDRCTACAPGYTNYPTCSGPTSSTSCTTTQCFGRGTGFWDGVSCTCSCSTGYAGTFCNSCALGYVGYPTCVVSGATAGVTLPPDQATYYQLGDCFATNGFQMMTSSKSIVTTETASACCDQCRRMSCTGWNFLTSSRMCELLTASGPIVSNADSLYGHSSTTATSQPGGSDDDSLIIALAIVGALLLLCCLLCLLWWFCCRKKKEKQTQPNTKDEPAYPPGPTPAVYPPYDFSPRPVSVDSSPEVYIHNPEQNPIPFPQKPQPPLVNVEPSPGEGFTSPDRPLPLLTIENTGRNNFLHRRDNTFA